MGEKHTIAKKKYWTTKTKAERSKIMSERMKKFWASKTPAQRKARSQMMNRIKSKLSTGS